MRILVLSDSHGLQYFMQRCVEALQPDAVIHLGDMVRDADKLAAQYPGLRFYQVAGNCDGCRVPPDYPEILIEDFFWGAGFHDPWPSPRSQDLPLGAHCRWAAVRRKGDSLWSYSCGGLPTA